MIIIQVLLLSLKLNLFMSMMIIIIIAMVHFMEFIKLLFVIKILPIIIIRY